MRCCQKCKKTVLGYDAYASPLVHEKCFDPVRDQTWAAALGGVKIIPEQGRFLSPRVEPKGDTPEEEFEALVHWMERDAGHSSRIVDSIRHPAFQSIVDYGQTFLPYIVARDIAWWEFEAIAKILGEHPPIPEASRGKLYEIRSIFREWLKEKLI